MSLLIDTITYSISRLVIHTMRYFLQHPFVGNVIAQTYAVESNININVIIICYLVSTES